MGPDPEKINSNSAFQQSDYVINQVDDEGMDVDQPENIDGYSRLNQEDGNYFMQANDDDSSESEFEDEDENVAQTTAVNTPNVPLIRSSSSELVAAVWNSSTSSSNIEISNEKSEQITKIMSKINLPNAPSWLNEINSENILDQIRNNRGTDMNVNKN